LSTGYQGGYSDHINSHVNAHSRWYQPGTGIFTSRDTWTLDPDPINRRLLPTTCISLIRSSLCSGSRYGRDRGVGYGG
jgi:hypothetical protein